MAERPLSAEERALWARVIATVEPLEGRLRPGPASEPSVPSEVEGGKELSARASTSLGMDAAAGKRANSLKPANTLDGGWDRRLGRGLAQPDLAVDLHGHNLDSAYRVLDHGLAHAIGSGARLLLLITGKPREPGSGRGTIRAAVGDWLAASRHADRIAAVRGAHPRHGGAGALYIILRRSRP